MRNRKNRLAGGMALVMTAIMLASCGATAELDATAGETLMPAFAQGSLSDSTAQNQQDAALWQALLANYPQMIDTPETAQATPESARPATVLTDSRSAALDEFCAAQPGSFSVFLLDAASGESYTYGGDTLYYPASLLKMPYALWLCQQDDAGLLDLDSELPNTFQGLLTEADNPILAAYNSAAVIPARTALIAMIRDSDNQAMQLLDTAWPGDSRTSFVQFLEDLHYSAAETCSISPIQGVCTVQDIGNTMSALYNYFSSGTSNAAVLCDAFSAGDYQALYLPGGFASAKKYGSWNSAFHDAAIVYAPYPYILCCMTDQGDTDIDFPAAPVQAMQQLGLLAFRYLNG